MTKTWDQLVAEGQELKIMEDRIEAEAGNVRWLWGDLALEVAPMGQRGHDNGAIARLREYADELDVSFESLRQYRAVADAWPNGVRSPLQPWIVHQQIAGRDDREELIASPVDVRTGEKVDRWTYRGMQRFLGQKTSPHYTAPPSTTEEKAEVALALVQDEEVAAAVRKALDAPKSESILEPQPVPAKSFEDRCTSWVIRLNSLMMEGAKLAAEAEEVGHSSDVATSHLAILLYHRLSERQFDAEIRRLLESEGA